MQYIILKAVILLRSIIRYLDHYKMMSIFPFIIDKRKSQFPTDVTFENTLLPFKDSQTKAWKAINARLQLILVCNRK